METAERRDETLYRQQATYSPHLYRTRQLLKSSFLNNIYKIQKMLKVSLSECTPFNTMPVARILQPNTPLISQSALLPSTLS